MKITAFNNELQAALIKGAIIVNSYFGQYQESVLIRYPKGQWYEGKFEYGLFQSHWLSSEPSWRLATSYNGTKREVVKRSTDSHFEDEYHGTQMAKKAAVSR